MEFHDDDNEDHLVGAVRGEHEEEFMSPTALALLESQRQKSAESQRQRIPVATEKVSVLDPQRYQELPDYARKSFVQEEKRRNGNDSCITQQGSSSIDQEGAYSVPSDARLHEILKRTAKKAAESPQLEIMIKVRKGDDHDFAFLQPQHQWHAYYLFCKQQQQQTDSKAPPQDSSHADQGMQSLLGVYSSSSDEEESDPPPDNDINNNDDNTTQVTAARTTMKRTATEEITASAAANHETDVERKKAKRLKKAKLLRGHFALKLLERNG